uniref:Uncharacterized protein n=1 Tax=Arundo donax TaxID=35708 RepID=A0A0A9BEG0_ARUDO
MRRAGCRGSTGAWGEVRSQRHRNCAAPCRIERNELKSTLLCDLGQNRRDTSSSTDGVGLRRRAAGRYLKIDARWRGCCC